MGQTSVLVLKSAKKGLVIKSIRRVMRKCQMKFRFYAKRKQIIQHTAKEPNKSKMLLSLTQNQCNPSNIIDELVGESHEIHKRMEVNLPMPG